MANTWFPLALKAFANKLHEWDADDMRVMLVKDTYTYDAADEFLSDIGASNDNGRSGLITGKTIATGGVLDGDDVSLVATDVVACNALIVFAHTGDDTTARCLLYIDTATNLPITPTAGQTVDVSWSNGSSKIAVL